MAYTQIVKKLCVNANFMYMPYTHKIDKELCRTLQQELKKKKGGGGGIKCGQERGERIRVK